MKKHFLFLIIISALLIFNCQDEDSGSNEQEQYPGAELVAAIRTGIEPADDHFRAHFGMTYFDNALYLTGFDTNEITKISMPDYQIESGYPASFNIPYGSGDFDIDPDDGSIWLCIGDATGRLLHYSSGITYLGELTGSDFFPCNVLIYQDSLYILNGFDNNILIQDKDSQSNVSDFYLTGHETEQIIDFCVYQNQLFFLTDGMLVVKTDLSGSVQETIAVTGIDDGTPLFGIAVYGQQMYFTIWDDVFDNYVLVTDMSGMAVNRWDLYMPYGWMGYYGCIRVIDGNIYVANKESFIFGMIIGFVLVYQQN